MPVLRAIQVYKTVLMDVTERPVFEAHYLPLQREFIMNKTMLSMTFCHQWSRSGAESTLQSLN